MRALLRTLGSRLEGLLFPADLYCICCGMPLAPGTDYALCPDCLAALHWAGERSCACCGRALSPTRPGRLCGDCRERPHRFERGFSCVQYGLLEKEMLHRFKYADKPYYAPMLGRLMAERMEAEDGGPFLLLPVPLHPARERRRGYNQAALLARETARCLGQPWRGDLLLRSRATAPMSRLGRGERAENIQNAFSLRAGAEDVLRGQHILLIDDILTTGSTADAASELLLSAGAARVWLLCFAAVPDWSDAGIAQACG